MQNPPEICEKCKKIVESSELEWKKVGGMSVGSYTQPMKWRLRDKYSSDYIYLNATLNKKLARAARLLNILKDHLEGGNGDYEIQDRRDELITKIEQYFEN